MEFFEAWKNLKEIPTQIDEATQITESAQDRIYQIEDELNVEIDSLGGNKYGFNFIYYLGRRESPIISNVLEKAKQNILSKSKFFREHAKITYFNTYAVEGSAYGITVQFELDSTALNEDINSGIIKWRDLDKSHHGDEYYYGDFRLGTSHGACSFYLTWLNEKRPSMSCHFYYPYDDAEYYWAKTFDVNENNFKDENIKRNWTIYRDGKRIESCYVSTLDIINKIKELDKNVKSRMMYESKLLKSLKEDANSQADEQVKNFYHGEKQTKNPNYGMDVNKFLDNCYASGGNWTSMLISGIKNLFPDYYEAMPEKKYSWEEVIHILNNDLGIETDN